MRTRTPRWSDEDAKLAEWVKERLDVIRGEVERCLATDGEVEGLMPTPIGMIEVARHLPIPDTPAHALMHGLIMAEVYRTPEYLDQQAAVRAAERGDTEPLAFLLERHWGLALGWESVKHLSPETHRLVIEFVRGVRNPKTGKKKGNRGPRRKSPEERRKMTPTHDAADLVPIIEEILRGIFLKQKSRDIRDRAIAIAAEISGGKQETVSLYLRRSPKDRQRL